MITVDEIIEGLKPTIEYFKKGGTININPKNKGKLKATEKKTGKSASQLAHSKNKKTAKRAQFALNARHFKHIKKREDGGEVQSAENGKVKNKASMIFIIRAHKQGGILDIINEYKKGGKSHKPGGSNVGKKHFANGKKRTGPYVGPSGGAPAGSYPIPDEAHGKAAIRMSGHAPNPQGIKNAVYRKYPELRPKKKKK